MQTTPNHGPPDRKAFRVPSPLWFLVPIGYCWWGLALLTKAMHGQTGSAVASTVQVEWLRVSKSVVIGLLIACVVGVVGAVSLRAMMPNSVYVGARPRTGKVLFALFVLPFLALPIGRLIAFFV